MTLIEINPNGRKMDDVLQKALARRTELRAELVRIEWFISAHRALAAGDMPPPRFGARVGARKREGFPGQPDIVAEKMIAVMRREGRPMLRSEIVQAMEAEGFVIPSSGDKCVYIGTILWRRTSQFFKMPDRRYILLGDDTRLAQDRFADVLAAQGSTP